MPEDALLRISGVHKKISELPALYGKVLANVNFYNPVEYAESLEKLFQDSILPHFELEEKKIFPLIFSRGNVEQQKTVMMIEHQHKLILEKLGRLSQMKSGVRESPAGKDKEKLASLCNELAAELNEHALKEDTILFPLLNEADIK